jgi:hypothetical protein
MNTLDSSFKLLMCVLILGWSSSCISPHNFINRKLLQQLTLPHKCVYVVQVTEVEAEVIYNSIIFLNQQKIQSEVPIIPVGGWCNWTCGLIQWERRIKQLLMLSTISLELHWSGPGIPRQARGLWLGRNSTCKHIYVQLAPGNTHCSNSSASSITGLVVGLPENQMLWSISLICGQLLYL